MEDKIKTADELIDINQKALYNLIEQFSKKEITEDEFTKMSGPFINVQATKNLMIEFAKMHLEAFKKKVEYEGINSITQWDGNPYTGEGSDYISIDKLNSIYPESNIK